MLVTDRYCYCDDQEKCQICVIPKNFSNFEMGVEKKIFLIIIWLYFWFKLFKQKKKIVSSTFKGSMNSGVVNASIRKKVTLNIFRINEYNGSDFHFPWLF